MISKLKRLLKGEGGITGLETAIILIAFVVVAAVFAFTVLSAGVFSSEKGKEAVYAGLGEVRGSMELRGSVIAKTNDPAAVDAHVDEVVFTVANVAGGEPINLITPTITIATGKAADDSDNRLVIDYRDKYTRTANIGWTLSWPVRSDTDNLLEDGELAKITIPLTASGTTHPTANDTFILEVKPEQGGVLVIERTLPAWINKVMDLH